MTTLHLKKSISWSSLRRGFPVVLLVLGLFALSPTARAVDPPPDGGYPNANTAEGDNALFSLEPAGFGNTGIGWRALFSDTTSSYNTAVGYEALLRNIGFYNTALGYASLGLNRTGSRNTANG